MLANSVKLLLVCAATGMLSACSTPCDAPGQLCAPIESNTRVLPPPPPPVPAPLPKPPAPEPVTFAVAVPDITSYDDGGKPNVAPVTGKPATGTALDMPAATAPAPSDGKVHHIGLLLPLRSASLGPAASLLRAGFMAAYERDRSGFEVAVIDTGDGSDDVLNKFAQAQQEQDIVVGPLSRSAVTAVANSDLVKKPTIALNHPDNRGEARLPAKLLVMGLSIEAEARQVAAWAASEQPRANALILSANSASQRRTSTAFKQEWLRQGGSADQVDLTATNGYLGDAELVQLRAPVEQPAGADLCRVGRRPGAPAARGDRPRPAAVWHLVAEPGPRPRRRRPGTGRRAPARPAMAGAARSSAGDGVSAAAATD